MAQLQTLASLSEVTASAWDALFDGAQPFLTHAFLSSLEDSGSVSTATGWQPAHQVLKDDSGTLLAVAPSYIKTHSRGEYVFDTGWADACARAGIAYYPKLLTGIPFSPVTGARFGGSVVHQQALVAAVHELVATETLSSWHINFTTADQSTWLTESSVLLARAGVQFHWQNPGWRDLQDYLDALRSSKRKKFRHEMHAVSRAGISYDCLQGHELTESQWDFVYACYSNTYHERGQLPYLTRAFFSLLAERLPQAIRVLIAKRGDKPVAMAFYLLGRDSLFGRYWGALEPIDCLHFDACFYQGMQLAMREEVAHFDAGAQGEHKLLRGFRPVLTSSWHQLNHPGLREAVARFVLNEAASVGAYARDAEQHLPYRVES
jgi:hypothetical protein